MKTRVLKVMKPEIVLFCNTQTFRNNFRQIFLLKSIIAPFSIICRQNESYYGICEFRCSIGLEEQFNKLFNIVCFLDTPHVAKAIEEVDQSLKADGFKISYDRPVLLRKSREGWL